MITYHIPNCRFGSYETASGEFGLVLYGLDVIKPEVRGFSTAITERFVAEAIFVAAADVDAAVQAVLADMAGFDFSSLATSMDEHHIDYRLPNGLVATVRPLPVRVSQSASSAVAA